MQKIVETQLLERGQIDRVLELAAITGENVLVSGPPGTAKSLQAERFFDHFPTARKFSVQLSKFSTEDVLFGPLDISALREGVYEHVYKNTVLDCHFAYIDEIFDASDVLLRSLLGVLNEHKFQRGDFKINCPLISAIGTANYTRLNDVTEAVVDRFLFQMNVKPLMDKTALFDFEENFSPTQRWTLPELRSLQKAVNKQSIPRKVRGAFIEVCKELGFTDRRIAKAINVIKATAMLRCNGGAGTVNQEDIRSLKYLSSLDSNSADATDKVIVDLLETAVYRAEQIEQLRHLEKVWEDIPDNDSVSALKKMASVIRQLVDVSPYDEEISVMRDHYLSEYREYYTSIRDGYLRRNGID